jgi:hypothetical protein
MGEKRNAYRILAGKPERKRSLGRARLRWVGSIKTDVREIGWDDMDWIDLAQDMDPWRALVNMIMNYIIFKHPVALYLYTSVCISQIPS